MLWRYKVKMQLNPNFMFHLVYLFIHVYIHSPGEHCHLAEKSEDAIGSNFQIRLIWEEWGCSWIRFPNWICLGIPLSSGGIRLAFEKRFWFLISQISGVWVWSRTTCPWPGSCGIPGYPGIFSKSWSRDSQKYNPGIFRDFQKPLTDYILRLSIPFIDHNNLFWDLWSLQEHIEHIAVL